MSTLPPLPEWSLRDDLGELVPSEIRVALRAYATAAISEQAAEVEALRDELRLCCELKREYQEQVASKVDEVEALRADAETRLLVLHNGHANRAEPGRGNT